MKNILPSLILLATLSGCGKSNIESSADTTSENKEAVTGYCTQELIDQLNSGELYLSYYQEKGISEGQHLVHAHLTYYNVLERYSKISCLGRNSSTGQILTITKDYVSNIVTSISGLLIRENRNCNIVGYAQTSAEVISCNRIRKFCSSLSFCDATDVN